MLLASVLLPGMLGTQQPASPSAGDACVYQQVAFPSHVSNHLMRFGFDFLRLREEARRKRGGGGGGGLGENKNNDGVVSFLNSCSDE